MRHVHQAILVDAPVRHVFELACDWRRQPEWNPYLRIENVNGPLDHVGTSFASTLNLLGHHVQSAGVVTEVIPHRLIRIHSAAAEGGVCEWVYRFEPEGEATRCTLDIEYEVPHGVRGAVEGVVYHGALDRAMRHIAENFAAVAEARVPVLA